MEVFDAVADHEDIPAEQVCRTCAFNNDRLAGVSLQQLAKARAAGIDLACTPVKFSRRRMIHIDKTTSDETQNISSVMQDGNVKFIHKPNKKVVGNVLSCGQSILDKCKNCVFFEPQSVWVPGGTRSNGSTWRKEVIVGGHCQRTDGCHRVPKGMTALSEDQSCYTCKFSTSFHTEWMTEHGDVRNIDLTPWEREQAIRNAPIGLNGEPQIGLAIWQARMDKGRVMFKAGPNTKQTSPAWVGLHRFFCVDVIDHTKYTVTIRFRLSGMVKEFDLTLQDDKTGIIHFDPAQPKTAVLQILSPYHRLYGIPDADSFTYPILPHKPCPSCNGAEGGCDRCEHKNGQVIDMPKSCMQRPHEPELVNPDCSACGTEPCYYHAKAPKRVILADKDYAVEEIVFTRPSIPRPVETNPARVIYIGGERAFDEVVDANGQEPDPVLLIQFARHYAEMTQERTETFYEIERFDTKDKGRSSLIMGSIPVVVVKKPSKKLIKKVQDQAYAALMRFDRTRPKSVNLGWNRPLPVEPWVPYCSLNLADPTKGIEFREQFGDRFGTPRGEQSTNPMMELGGHLRPDTHFSLSKAMQLEEWIRVTNPGEFLQNEIMEGLNKLRSQQEGEEVRIFDQIHTTWQNPTKLGIGVPNSSIQFDTTEELVDWLWAEAEMPNDDETEFPGFKATNRYMVLGYEFFRNTKKLTKNDIPSVVDMGRTPIGDPITASEEASNNAIFICSQDASHRFDPTEVDLMTRQCPDEMVDPETEEIIPCSGVLTWYETAHEYASEMGGTIRNDTPQRRLGSPGVAATDSRRWQSRQRLEANYCEHWTARRRSYIAPIVLGDVRLQPMLEALDATNIKVTGRPLNEEELEHNQKVETEYNDVLLKRENYIAQHPLVTPRNLKEILPFPEHFVYVVDEPQTGSLAKGAAAPKKNR